MPSSCMRVFSGCSSFSLFKCPKNMEINYVESLKLALNTDHYTHDGFNVWLNRQMNSCIIHDTGGWSQSNRLPLSSITAQHPVKLWWERWCHPISLGFGALTHPSIYSLLYCLLLHDPDIKSCQEYRNYDARAPSCFVLAKAYIRLKQWFCMFTLHLCIFLKLTCLWCTKKFYFQTKTYWTWAMS